MNSLFSLSSLRTCTASLSSRSSLNAVSRQTRRVAFSRRQYSTETTEAEAGKNGEASKSETKPESDLEAKLKEKEAEVVDLTGRLRYLQADFLNLQRNSAREKEQTRDFAITRFASDLLETADVLSMALKSVPQSVLSPPESPDSPATPSAPPAKTALEYLIELHTGVEMTQRQLQQTLFKYHVKPFDPIGDEFDPNRHEALYQAPIPGKEPGTIVDVQKIGYTIKDRVLRAAQVGVAQEVQS